MFVGLIQLVGELTYLLSGMGHRVMLKKSPQKARHHIGDVHFGRQPLVVFTESPVLYII